MFIESNSIQEASNNNNQKKNCENNKSVNYPYNKTREEEEQTVLFESHFIETQIMLCIWVWYLRLTRHSHSILTSQSHYLCVCVLAKR